MRCGFLQAWLDHYGSEALTVEMAELAPPPGLVISDMALMLRGTSTRRCYSGLRLERQGQLVRVVREYPDPFGLISYIIRTRFITARQIAEELGVPDLSDQALRWLSRELSEEAPSRILRGVRVYSVNPL